MKDKDPKLTLGRLREQVNRVAELAKTARRNKMSLRGDNFYGRKFHDAIIAMTATISHLDPVFRGQNHKSACTAWAHAKRNCETLKSLDADGPTRMAAVKSFDLLLQTEIQPGMDSLLAAPVPLTVDEQADLGKSPLLTATDVDAARKMAQLYVVIHCYENSARRVVVAVLSKKLGTNWWDQAASAAMKQKVSDRQTKEAKNKWLTSRGASPLFYVDWGDILSLIRKYEADFKTLIPDYKFVEVRFEEMERFRNIVAHNGVLPTEDEFNHVILSFRQWCKQLA